MSTSQGFSCTSCGKRHEFSPYVFAHMHTPLSHRCDLCGAVHSVLNGTATLTLPGHIPKKTTQFELGIAAGIQTHDEPAVTAWIHDYPPMREGYYHIRFPNGTEADRNWWWDNTRGVFEYHKGHSVSLSFISIGAWRGLDRPYV